LKSDFKDIAFSLINQFALLEVHMQAKVRKHCVRVRNRMGAQVRRLH